MFDLILNRLRGKRILILGFGREGRSTFSFLKKYLPGSPLAIADKNASAFANLDLTGVETISGNDYLNSIYAFDVVIKTPGISLKDFDTKTVEITSQTDLFLSQFHNQTIGISGTKGKSTTTSLIYHLLKSSGHDAILTGNIGIPCFDVMEQIRPDSIVVYELSAHQLEYVHNSPRVGVLLNVFEEHLDHFGTFERYKNAKLNLLRFMQETDTAVVHDSLMDDVLPLFVNAAVFSTMQFGFEDSQCDTLDAERSRSAQSITTFFDAPKSLPILGQHNILNAKAALCACEAYGFSAEDLMPYLYTFTPLEHRLERVGTFGGVRFFNDSISTIPQAAIAACQTLKKVDFLLLGGFDRDIDYTPLVDFLAVNHVPHLLFTGKAGERMMKLLIDRGVSSQMHTYSSMEEAFAVVKANAKQGDVCLLSPAAASYDQYKNFEERGRKFKALAQTL